MEGALHFLPRTSEARKRVMDGSRGDRQPARKFIAGVAEARPGEVPPGGGGGAKGKGRTSASGIVPGIAASRAIPDINKAFSLLMDAGEILPPPYDPWGLVVTVDESEVLPVAIEAMATNITGHGFELEPLFPTVDEVTGAEVDPPAEALSEREDLELFLASLCPKIGLCGLLQMVDTDVETIGWGTIEVMRDEDGKEARFGYIPGYTVRLGPEGTAVAVETTIRHPSTGELVTVTGWEKFRKFAQVKDSRTVWFKEYGDPRHLNWKTGKFQDAPWGEDDNGNSLEATELIYVKRHHPATPYGVPCWVGGTPQARAGRAAAELIVDYFENSPIGVKLAMVSGGKWTAASLTQLQDSIDHAGRGRENAWAVLPLEAELDSSQKMSVDETKDAAPRIALEDLTTTLEPTFYSTRDSLIDRAAIRLRSMFRLGSIYFGDSEGESNRAAADTARAIGEEQVFGPIRRRRWEQLFMLLLAGRGIQYWKLCFKGADTGDDTEALAATLGPLVEGGGASVNDLRALMADLTETPIEAIAEPWADRPLSLVLALIEAGLDPNKPLADLAAEVAAKEEQARADAQAQAEAALQAKGPPGAGGGKPGGFPPKGGGKPSPPGGGKGPPKQVVGKALEDLDAFVQLRAELAEQLRAEGDHGLAAALIDADG